ncbi:alcohol oxidase [Gloeophyllum trabeum ATCC 11539]|uniref:Alcohol oxidase n=1 Tax=Gloeophyllum trabeum (strain ATCC 11539 / FP-39264 / Madison 617) TaxID=670483 RepID=S7PUV0_GLOTA|nr:alcohol oxidase [Gloeophyllum trabeum ATCC 11539]EPQ51193.1 alcohol oxidase [Gloeophyllum trabeum ATCC 11539]
MVFANIRDISGKQCHFVIIARLTEDPSITVAVLEAGPAHLEDPAILTPTGFTGQLGNKEYDWMYQTVPQNHLDNLQYIINSGRGLGGSSSMNFLAWTRPPREDIDALVALGNPGWDWESFIEYCKKSERFVPGAPDVLAMHGQKYEQGTLGTQGPVTVSFPKLVSRGDIALRSSLKSKGIPVLDNALSGQVTGTWCSVATIDPETQTRSNSVTAYLLPHIDRPNLVVLTGAVANSIITTDSSGTVVGSGIAFTHDGAKHEVYAERDIILCAGAIQSPKIHELSGIGDRRILERIGVDVRLDLPGVGNNLQEHITYVGISFELKEDSGVETWDPLRDPAFAALERELYDQHKEGLFTMVPSGLTFLPLQILSENAAAIVERHAKTLQEKAHLYTPGTLLQHELQLENLRNPQLPECELIAFPGFRGNLNEVQPGRRYFSIVPTLCHPFSRGSVHIASSDPEKLPQIDPCYLQQDIDMDIMVEAFRFARSLANEEPLREIIAKEACPGEEISSEEAIREHVKRSCKSTWHTCGSLSMLPRECGGVVDPQLKVWGTKNIRIADLSIVPLQVASHTQALVYSIAERAADILKSEIGSLL